MTQIAVEMAYLYYMCGNISIYIFILPFDKDVLSDSS